MTLERQPVLLADPVSRPQCVFLPVIRRLTGSIAHTLGISADDPGLVGAAGVVLDEFYAQGIAPTSRHEHRYRTAILRRYGAQAALQHGEPRVPTTRRTTG